MASTQASSSHPSKKIKLTIIPPRQLFVNISSDEDVTTTPSPITTSSSPSPLNAPSKTPSTKDTSSTFGTTSSSFESKPQSSLPTSNDTPSPKPSNPFLDNIMDAPPRPSHPLPLQSHPSLDITLSLSPITPLDHILDTLSPPSLQPQPQPPLMDFVMSDSKDSTVTYMAVSGPFEGLSDIGSLGVDGPPMMPEDPYAYVVAAFQALPSPDYVPGPKEPGQAPLSPEFVLEEDPSDYPTDRGDDDDDDDESSNDDDDDVDEDEDEEEEEDHPASVDSVPPPLEADIARLLAIPSPLSPWSPPLPVSSLVLVSPPPLPASPTYPLGFRAAMIRQRAEGVGGVCIAQGLRYKVYKSSYAPTARPSGGFRADYGFVAILDDKIRRDPERDVDFVTTVRQDTDEIYGRLDDVQDGRSLMSGRLNMLFRDRRAHARTALLMKREARLSREAWGRSMDTSDIARSKVRALRTTVLAQ
ncbi:hypothetical protein Tco_0105792 [Tanacetum coccineum]